MPQAAIVVTGEPVEAVRQRRGGFATLIRQALGLAAGDVVELDAREPLPPLVDYSAVILSGSPASVVDRAPWTVAAEARVAEAVACGVFVLGICFGHQLLGQALGGAVTRNPRGREIGTVAVDVVERDPLLEGAPARFLAHMTHVDSVTQLPPGATVLARTALDPHAVVRFGERAWGVQFHPEMDAEILGAYVEARRAAIRDEGLEVEAIRGALAETPEARGILARFLELSAAG